LIFKGLREMKITCWSCSSVKVILFRLDWKHVKYF
jgi:hypothetical protein